MRSSVVSTRIDEKTKEILRKAGVNISQEAREHLEEVAAKIAAKKHLKELDSLLEDVTPAKRGFSSKSVREDRASH